MTERERWMHYAGAALSGRLGAVPNVQFLPGDDSTLHTYCGDAARAADHMLRLDNERFGNHERRTPVPVEPVEAMRA